MYDRCMVVKTLHLTEEQIEFLEKFDSIPFAEHVRRALDQYIPTLVKPATTSPSVINVDVGRSKPIHE